MAHAVWYEPISRVLCRLCAEMPSLLVANSQQVWNQTVNGVRVRSKIVPAVAEVRASQAMQQNRPSLIDQPPDFPHRGHTNPSGQRSHSR